MTIQERRKKAGMRQIDLAKKLQVNQAAVSNWERGKYLPQRKYQVKLAKIFGCKQEELFSGVMAEKKGGEP